MLNGGSVTFVSADFLSMQSVSHVKLVEFFDFTEENRSHKQAQILLPVSITCSELMEGQMEGLLVWGSPPVCPAGSSGGVQGAVNLPLCWLRKFRSSGTDMPRLVMRVWLLRWALSCGSGATKRWVTGITAERKSCLPFSQQWRCLCTMSCQNTVFLGMWCWL